ncbi:hypothetical protein [Thalassorhabdomicrobium marinisediminis]|uniref:hypothetical protein n=1 Tax=Thalassorhabdomicrobium marinisediminis TaxID=2170577 RepID=UPI0011B23EF7|nr:hypothetical protein [Thalassorhabdomicrobium marinisediminis]
MDYLITSNTTSAPLECILDKIRPFRINNKNDFRTLTNKNFNIISNLQTWDRGSSTFFFCGNILLDNLFHTQHDKISDKVIDILQGDISLASGTYTFIEADSKQNTFKIELDQLNGYPCFYYCDQNHYAISGNIHMLANYLSMIGVPTKRIINSFLADLTLGSGIRGGTLYENIKCIGFDELFVGGEKLAISRKTNLDVKNIENLNYKEVIYDFGECLASRLNCVTGMSGSKLRVVDLTGGMDSRIILAGLYKLGSLQNWYANTLFPHPNPDGNFANFFCEKYELTMSLRVSPNAPGSMEQRVAQDIFFAQGSGIKRGLGLHFDATSMVRIHGGYGELGGKSHDTNRFLKYRTEPTTISSMIQSYVKSVEALGHLTILSDDAKDWMWEVIRKEINTILGEGYTFSQIPILTYRRGRARSHFGHISALRGQNSYHPDFLNDIRLSQGALLLGAENCRHGKVNFDIIRNLAGNEIVKMPLANERWHRELFVSDSEFAALSVPPLTAKSPPLFETAPNVLETRFYGSYDTARNIDSPTSYSRLASYQYMINFLKENKEFIHDDIELSKWVSPSVSGWLNELSLDAIPWKVFNTLEFLFASVIHRSEAEIGIFD